MNDTKKPIKSGYVAIVGCPNVGKSTLLNSILDKKISITSANSQTTRGCVSSIFSGDDFAIKLIDTPGYIDKSKHLLDHILNKSAIGWMDSVDLVLLVIDSRAWTTQDEAILSQISFEQPVLLVMNKVDLIKDKESLLPKMKGLSEKIPCREIIPVSAVKGINIDKLRVSMLSYLSTDHPLESQILLSTPAEVIISERIREKIFRYLSAEIPRNSVVVVRKIIHKKNVDCIYASIIVGHKNHKKIVIGKNGSKLKEIGRSSRMELEKLFNKKIYLELFVKVEENWVNKDHLMQEYQIFYNQQY